MPDVFKPIPDSIKNKSLPLIRYEIFERIVRAAGAIKLSRK
jgi:hypothetical protein